MYSFWPQFNKSSSDFDNISYLECSNYPFKIIFLICTSSFVFREIKMLFVTKEFLNPFVFANRY